MRHTDVAIVGGGFAGSMVAAMLGRIGHDAILVDPHPVYPKDFRCEKLDASQIALLRKTGLADAVARASTLDQEVWIARFGRVVEKKPSEQRLPLRHRGQCGARRDSCARARDLRQGGGGISKCRPPTPDAVER